jgi:hypothetical protein
VFLNTSWNLRRLFIHCFHNLVVWVTLFFSWCHIVLYLFLLELSTKQCFRIKLVFFTLSIAHMASLPPIWFLLFPYYILSDSCKTWTIDTFLWTSLWILFRIEIDRCFCFAEALSLFRSDYACFCYVSSFLVNTKTASFLKAAFLIKAVFQKALGARWVVSRHLLAPRHWLSRLVLTL